MTSYHLHNKVANLAKALVCGLDVMVQSERFRLSPDNNLHTVKRSEVLFRTDSDIPTLIRLANDMTDSEYHNLCIELEIRNADNAQH